MVCGVPGVGLETAAPTNSTAAATAVLPESEQRQLIADVVNLVTKSLRSETDACGARKPADKFQQDRAAANLLRALFTPDKDKPDKDPIGYTVGLQRIKNTAKTKPNELVADILGTFTETRFNKYYTEQVKAWFGEKTDSYQEAFFRLSITTEIARVQAKRREDRLKQRQEKLEQEMRQMWADAIVLSDGRHVLFSSKNGEFYSISKEPGRPEEIVTGVAKAEARRIYNCMQAGNTRRYCNPQRTGF